SLDRGPGYETQILKLDATLKFHEARIKEIKMESQDTLAEAARGYQAAIDELQIAVEKNPKDFESYLIMAKAHHSLGDFRSAMADHVKAIERAPEGERENIILKTRCYLDQLKETDGQLAKRQEEEVGKIPKDPILLHQITSQRLKIAELSRDVEALKSLGLSFEDPRKKVKHNWLNLNLGYAYYLTHDQQAIRLFLAGSGEAHGLKLDEYRQALGRTSTLRDQADQYSKLRGVEAYLASFQDAAQKAGLTQDDFPPHLKDIVEEKDSKITFKEEYFKKLEKGEPGVTLVGKRPEEQIKFEALQ